MWLNLLACTVRLALEIKLMLQTDDGSEKHKKKKKKKRRQDGSNEKTVELF